MCLHRKDKNPAYPKNKTFGWKMFKRGGLGLYLPVFEQKQKGKPLPLKTWIKANQFGDAKRLNCWQEPKRYKAGFHFHFTRHDARLREWEGCVIKKISFRNLVATGTQFGFRVAVAEEIYIHD